MNGFSVRIVMRFVLLLTLAPGWAAAQTLQDGLRALEGEQHDRAHAIFRALLARAPTAEHHFHMGRYYLAAQQPDSARLHFEQALAEDPRSGLNHVGMGEAEIARGNLTQAAQHFEQAKKVTKSRDAAVFYYIGLAYMRHEAKDLQASIVALNEAVRLDPDQAEYYVALGEAYEQGGDASAAAINYDRAGYRDPGLASAHVHAGDLYVRARNYGEAMKEYEEGMAADSGYAPVHRSLAELYFLAKQYDQAVAHYRRYIDLTRATPEKLFTYAGYLHLNKQYTESLEALLALDGTYENPVAHRLLAYNYFETGQFEEGLMQMQAFFERADSAGLLDSDYEYFGRLHLAAGADTLAAIEYLRKAVAADTSKWSLHRDIATAYLSSKHYEDAAREYESMAARGLTLKGTDYLNLGKAYFFDARFAEADSAFARVNAMAGTSAVGWLWRGRSSAQIDSTAVEGRAAPFYEKYIELTPDTSRYQRELIEAHYYLASYYYLQNDFARVEEHVNAVLALDPAHEHARALMAAARQP